MHFDTIESGILGSLRGMPEIIDGAVDPILIESNRFRDVFESFCGESLCLCCYCTGRNGRASRWKQRRMADTANMLKLYEDSSARRVNGIVNFPPACDMRL